MCAPGIKDINNDLGITSPHLSTLVVTIYMLGLAIGPMLIAPLSEVYGRLPVYYISSIVFIAFVIGNALSRDVAQFMVFRFFSGCAGGTPMALGGGTIADVTTLAKRGGAMGLFNLGPLTGPVRFRRVRARRLLLLTITYTGPGTCDRRFCRGAPRMAMGVLDTFYFRGCL